MVVEVATGVGVVVEAASSLVTTVPEAGTTAAFPVEASDETLPAVVYCEGPVTP